MSHRLLFIVLFIVPAAHAGVAEGLAASRNGDYEAAFHELEPEAKHGNAEAQYHLGVMYDAGQGVHELLRHVGAVNDFRTGRNLGAE